MTWFVPWFCSDKVFWILDWKFQSLKPNFKNQTDGLWIWNYCRYTIWFKYLPAWINKIKTHICIQAVTCCYEIHSVSKWKRFMMEKKWSKKRRNKETTQKMTTEFLKNLFNGLVMEMLFLNLVQSCCNSNILWNINFRYRFTCVLKQLKWPQNPY